MIEDSKIVKSIEAKPGGKSGTYWTVTWQDDKHDNIFNADWLPLLEQSQSENRPLHFTKEKQEGSKFYNIKTLELVDTPPPSSIGEASQREIAPQEKGMWWKEAGECFRSKLFNKDDNGAGSFLWRAYIKQMLSSLEKIIPEEKSPAKSHLVEAAKKLGAEEIKGNFILYR